MYLIAKMDIARYIYTYQYIGAGGIAIIHSIDYTSGQRFAAIEPKLRNMFTYCRQKIRKKAFWDYLDVFWQGEERYIPPRFLEC